MLAHLEQLLRDLTPQVLGPVARRCRDFALAEDAVQEALLAAATQWPREGVPENPRGWLIQVAVRRMTDAVRSEVARRKREAEVVGQCEQVRVLTAEDEDDTLSLFFMCCHASLTNASAIALTLRAVGGLTTAEIARAFFVPESTMAQRISRAKQSIAASGLGIEMPDTRERAGRLRVVMHVLYLIFNEGYTATAGPDLQRVDLSSEAIRLTRLVHALLPEDPELTGLLALLLLTDARRSARSGPGGELIPLLEQDRGLWDRRQIEEGVAMLTRALSKGLIGAYQLQAAIAAVHDEAGCAAATDWPQILALYDLLKRMSDNPMAALNHAIAAAMVHGPARGLDLLSALESDSRMRNHYRLKAVRAHLLEMAGDHENAQLQYRSAAAQTASLPERDYLLRKAARLAGGAQ